MQYLDNDMDEMFKKAGSDYPLKTDNADFDKVLAGLRPEPVSLKPDYKRYSWLLLLLLLPFGYVLVNNKSDKGVQNALADKQSVQSEQDLLKYNQPAKPEGNHFSDNHLPAVIPADKSGKYPGEIPETTKTLKYINRATDNSINATTQNAISTVGRPVFPMKQQYNDRYSIERQNISYPKPVINFPPLPISPVPSNPEKNKKQPNSFYLGILAGPDFSTVKYQNVKNMGYSVGILAGYRFAKRWSVETGFIYDSKKYYTDGEHFDKAKAGIPPSVYVESLDGSCNMFEVPLLLRYDFSENKNGFFAGIGATSYFMKKEKYTYDAYASGAYYEGHRTYDNSGNWFFSNAQFSIGYNKQLTSKTNLRIEPYIKVPIKDIGVGNLPITSTGIYFSVTQRIK